MLSVSMEGRTGCSKFHVGGFQTYRELVSRNENYVGPGKQSQRLIISVRERKGQAEVSTETKTVIRQ